MTYNSNIDIPKLIITNTGNLQVSCYYESIHDSNRSTPVKSFITNVNSLDQTNHKIECDLPSFIIEKNNQSQKVLNQDILNITEPHKSNISSEAASQSFYYLDLYLVINKTIQSNTKQRVTVLPRNIITNVFPKIFYDNGMTTLTIKGKNFFSFDSAKKTVNTEYPNSNLNCKYVIIRVGSNNSNTVINNDHVFYSTANVVTSNELKCGTPDIRGLDLFTAYSEKNILVKLFISQGSNGSSNYDSGNYELLYTTKTPIINQIDPGHVYANYATSLTIKGVNFQNISSMKIKFFYTQYDNYYYTKDVYPPFLDQPLFVDEHTLFVISPFAWQLFDYISDSSTNLLDMKVHIEVTLNGEDWVSHDTEERAITIYNPPNISRIDPNWAFQHSTVTVHVYGKYFNDNLKYCKFGDYKTPIIQVISINELTCMSPHVDQIEMEARFGLETEAEELFDSIKLDFKFFQTFFIPQDYISPNRSQLAGGIEVSFKFPLGYDLSQYDKSLLRIFFKGEQQTVEADQSKFVYNLLANKMTIILPPFHRQEDVNIEIRYNGLPLNRNLLKFYYWNYDYTGITIFPTLGPTTGGTLIHITVDPAVSLNQEIMYTCVFRSSVLTFDSKVHADYIDSRHLNCLTPLSEPGVSRFGLDFDGVFESSINIEFLYYNPIQIFKIWPEIISQNSNCVITITADDLIPNPLSSVSIEDEITPRDGLTYITDELNRPIKVQYKISRLFDDGVKYQYVSNNSYDYSYSAINNIYVYNSDDLKVLSIFPTKVPFITISDIGYVEIRGENLIRSHPMKAKIEDKFYEIENVDDTLVRMAYPELLELSDTPGPKRIEFTYNDCDWFGLNSNIIFYHDLIIEDIFPRVVEANKFVNITILSQNVWDFEELSVKFLLYDTTFTPEMVYSETNRNNTYLYSKENSREELSYKHIDQDITVQKSFLPNYLVNNTFYNEFIQTCFYVSGNVFTCPVPLIPPGSYKMAFTQNLVDYSKFFDFLVVKNLNVKRVSPDKISNVYTENILVFGDNFFKYKSYIEQTYSVLSNPKGSNINNYRFTVECFYEPDYEKYHVQKDILFESVTFNTGNKVLPDDSTQAFSAKGKILSNNIISCSVPENDRFKKFGNMIYNLRVKLKSAFMYRNSENNPLGITLNKYIDGTNMEFSSNNREVMVFEYLPDGYSIDKSTKRMIECPQGFTCNGRSSLQSVENFKERICPAGFYSDKPKSNLCKPCENGFFCKNPGSLLPQPAPLGSEATIKKRNFVKMCPYGNFCSSQVYNSTTETLLLPQYDYKVKTRERCKVGTYCIGGMSSGLVNPLKFDHAQLCSMSHLCTTGSTSPLGSGPCPSGHYCPNMKDSGIECPTKYYCPQRGNVKPLQCPPGTYSGRKGNRKCQTCPQGFFCPYEGLVQPLPCLAGFECNNLEIMYPYKDCQAGRICLQGTKIKSIPKLCELRDYKNECDPENHDEHQLDSFKLSDSIANFLGMIPDFHKYLCCLKTINIEYMLTDMDSFFSNLTSVNYEYDSVDYSMKNYKYKVQYNLMDNEVVNGRNLLNLVYNEEYDKIFEFFEMNIEQHKEFTKFYFRNMYNNLQDGYLKLKMQPIYLSPFICPRKYFCLRGTATSNTTMDYEFAPQLCLAGTYCMDGAYSILGTKTCPPGYNCPAGSDQPSQSITQALQSKENNLLDKIETPCYSGYFTTGDFRSECMPCPDGYECESQSTSWPNICVEGFFRSNLNICTGCPKGTYSFQKGTKDVTECLPCPSGTQCTQTGTSAEDSIKPCNDGSVCPDAAGLKDIKPCPNGFYCKWGTPPQNQFKTPCNKGYVCGPGTGDNNKWQAKCQIHYYCPKASMYYEQEERRFTKCPKGTGQSTVSGLESLQDCIPEEQFLIVMDYKLLKVDESTTSTTDETSTPQARVSSNEDSSNNNNMIDTNSTNSSSANDTNDYYNYYLKIDEEINKEESLHANNRINPHSSNTLGLDLGLINEKASEQTELTQSHLGSDSDKMRRVLFNNKYRNRVINSKNLNITDMKDPDFLEITEKPNKKLNNTDNTDTNHHNTHKTNSPPKNNKGKGKPKRKLFSNTYSSSESGSNMSKRRTRRILQEQVSESYSPEQEYIRKMNSMDLVKLEFDKYYGITYDDFKYNDDVIPVFSYNPINDTIGLKPIYQLDSEYKLDNSFEQADFQEQVLDKSSIKPHKDNYYFIPANTYCLLTFDWRHIKLGDTMFIYGIDWDLSLVQYYPYGELPQKEDIETFLKINPYVAKTQNSYKEKIQIMEMPELFLNKKHNKAQVHEMIYYSLEDVILKVSVNFYNGLYTSLHTQFKDSCIVEWVKPDRVTIGDNRFYYVQLSSEQEIDFPVNIPMIDRYKRINTKTNDIKQKIQSTFVSYYNYTFSKERITARNHFEYHKIEINRNTFRPNSIYWGDSKFINIPYLPYFSNCEGYGKYIPLWALFEQNPQCNLMSVEDTKFLTDTSFGKKAQGDNCELDIKCIYDEEIDFNHLEESTTWFNTGPDTTLFSITVDGQYISDINKIFEDEEKFPVAIGNSEPVLGYPSQVNLTISYYQMSPTEKKIVEVSLEFGDANEGEFREYDLFITYVAFSHTELMIAFALSYMFYVVLFCIQGLAAVLIVMLFLIYSRLMSRINPTPRYRFRTYIPLTIPPAVTGFFAIMLPIWAVIFIILFSMTGKLLKMDIGLCSLQKEENSNSNDDCYKSIFDGIEYLPSSSKTQKLVSYGRIGVALIVVGLYLLARGIGIMLPNNRLFHQTSFDMNFWKYFSWKRANFIFIFGIVFLSMVYTMNMSYSDFWGNNIWYTLYMFKAVGIVFENIVESSIDDRLLHAMIPLTWDINQALFSFGADDLIDYLNTYFVELGITMIERTYLEKFTDWAVDFIPDTIDKVKNYLNKMFKFNVNLDEEFDYLQNNKKEGGNSDEDNFGDVPIFISSSEEDSLESKKSTHEDVEKADFNILMQKNPNEKMQEEGVVKDEEKEKNKSNMNDDEIEMEYERKIEQEQEKERGNVEKLLDYITDYTSDLFINFFNVFLLALIWMFYFETSIFQNYGIKIQNFIYFLFSTFVIVPFNASIDYMFQNLIEYFDGTPIHDFYDYMRWRFRTRRYFWALDETKVNFALEEKSRNIEKLCFSSQYFVILTVFISGAFFMQMGFATLMNQRHNPFGDMATVTIFIYIFSVCYLIDEVTIMGGKLSGIWRLDTVKDLEKMDLEAKDKDIEKTHYDYASSESDYNEEALKVPALRKNWAKIEYLKEQENIMDINLRTERLLLSTFRKKFINENKKWIQNLISELLTPRTLVMNKDVIINALEVRFGKKSPNISLKSLDMKENVSGSEESDSSLNIEQIKYDKFKEYFERRCSKKNSKVPYIILEIWKRRASLSIKLFNLVKLSIASKKKNKCMNCGSVYLLRTLCLEPVIMVFERYCRHFNYIYNASFYDPKLFKEFFLETTDIITLCVQCEH
eukprot:CAMPEP_0170539486 /NCGR_PEP_ID=MMETSP0209-20121228/103958_1 /TAXON_ID=665100 ORGANISM="Litonotus pictus, Strain P1" /NCGR_SAMPLE_ID=MMETSP0209 /ASSEMBLY_ACC=CAM_ASM_000301 /LENGTH=3449 /DNA_ID=CAMNT_0010841431 /DNA_START=2857 /DNA_END=13206 /DNA_ORIENTATION=+